MASDGGVVVGHPAPSSIKKKAVPKKKTATAAALAVDPQHATLIPTVAPRRKKKPDDTKTTNSTSAAAGTVLLIDPTADPSTAAEIHRKGDGDDNPSEQPKTHEIPQRAALIEFLEQRSGLTPIQVRDAEIGVYNWVLGRAEGRRIARNWRNPKFRALYDSKARSVAANLDPASYVANDRLVARISEREFFPHNVASMSPENVFPERWREVVEMKVRRDEYISNAKPTAMTDQFKCARCKKRECSYMELQTRSCDEPATLFIQCLSCGHRWRIG